MAMGAEDKVKAAVEKGNEYLAKALKMEQRNKEKMEESEKPRKKVRFERPGESEENRGEKRRTEAEKELDELENDLEGDEDMGGEVEELEVEENTKRRRKRASEI